MKLVRLELRLARLGVKLVMLGLGARLGRVS